MLYETFSNFTSHNETWLSWLWYKMHIKLINICCKVWTSIQILPCTVVYSNIHPFFLSLLYNLRCSHRIRVHKLFFHILISSTRSEHLKLSHRQWTIMQNFYYRKEKMLTISFEVYTQLDVGVSLGGSVENRKILATSRENARISIKLATWRSDSWVDLSGAQKQAR